MLIKLRRLHGTQFCESNSSLLRNPTLYNSPQRKPATYPSNPVHTHTPFFFNVHFHIFLPVTPAYSKLYLPSYVYWTVHHLDSWIKRDQLDVTCFFISLFNAQHVSDVNTTILRCLRLICWVISWVVLLWFDACWCYVVVWLVWCGIRMQAEACIRIPHHLKSFRRRFTIFYT